LHDFLHVEAHHFAIFAFRMAGASSSRMKSSILLMLKETSGFSR
jgi:hypothetical protein